MRISLVSLIVCLAVSPVLSAQDIPPEDTVRLNEFYRLAPQIEDSLWPGLSRVPAPILLVTQQKEFLMHFPVQPPGFTPVADGILARPRVFGANLQATFPAFGPPSVIVIGEPTATESKTSTPWEIVLMHEHFHQLQYSVAGYTAAVNGLGLSHGDDTGMWMINYPFPYADPRVVHDFNLLRNQLLATVRETDPKRFRKAARQYIQMRDRFFAQLSPDDRKYLSFQLWQEGIARYIQIKAAEAAAGYTPTAAYAGLPDYEPFSSYAAHARADTLDELQKINIASARRVIVYSFGATEGLLLDRINPQWKDDYLKHPLFTEDFFRFSTQ